MRTLRPPHALLLAALCIATSCKPTVTGTNATPPPGPTATAVDRKDEWWIARHKAQCEAVALAAREGNCRVLFLGDSITQAWETDGIPVWKRAYAPLGAINLGIGGDRTQHVLWRVRNSGLAALAKPPKGAAPEAAVLMIGTNNSDRDSAAAIAEGTIAIVRALRDTLPRMRVLLLAIFPRGEQPDATRQKLSSATALAVTGLRAEIGSGWVAFLDIGPALMRADGTIDPAVMPDDPHLSPVGYLEWERAMRGDLERLLVAGRAVK